MLPRFYKILLSLLISIAWGGADFILAPFASAASLTGRILLQVEESGQAWYVNPVDNRRYYLGRPADAYNIMRQLALGVSNKDLKQMTVKAPARLAGRILLQVEERGQAYYVNPLTLQLHYLGRPTDAYNIMRSLGLGISNKNLALITEAPKTNLETVTNSPASTTDFIFNYKNKEWKLELNLNESMYRRYQQSTKTYTYYGAPPDNIRDLFYALFFIKKSGDDSLDQIIGQLQNLAKLNNWDSDELAEAALAVVQNLNYDHEKLIDNDNRNTKPYYPYETLYLKKGVCSDKSFLAVALLRQLGYGAAILDFPDKNHSAAGLACPVELSLNGSGYCYVETTNYFPVGVIPQSINDGQAQVSGEEFGNLFEATGLGKIEIYQKSVGQIYSGIVKTKKTVAELIDAQADLKIKKQEINVLIDELALQEQTIKEKNSLLETYLANQQTREYNELVPLFNNLVNNYNVDLEIYHDKIEVYNQLVADFNKKSSDFYQKNN